MLPSEGGKGVKKTNGFTTPEILDSTVKDDALENVSPFRYYGYFGYIYIIIYCIKFQCHKKRRAVGLHWTEAKLLNKNTFPQKWAKLVWKKLPSFSELFVGTQTREDTIWGVLFRDETFSVARSRAKFNSNYHRLGWYLKITFQEVPLQEIFLKTCFVYIYIYVSIIL